MKRTVLKAAVASAALASMTATVALAEEQVTQQRWAEQLASSFEWTEVALSAGASADDYAALLAGRERVSVPATAGTTSAQDGNVTTYRYDVDVPRPGSYLLKVRIKGGPTFVTVDARPSALVPKGDDVRWADVGSYALSAGKHAIAVTAPRGEAAPSLEMLSGCNPIAPISGWQMDQPLTFGDKGATLVRALNLRSRLAKGSTHVVGGAGEQRAFRLAREGEYTVLFQAPSGSDLTYRVDGCQEQKISSSGAGAGSWLEGETFTLGPGAHVITLTGEAKGIAQTKLRLTSRNSQPVDYVRVLESLGVPEGAPATVVGPQAASGNLTHPAVKALLKGPRLAAGTQAAHATQGEQAQEGQQGQQGEAANEAAAAPPAQSQPAPFNNTASPEAGELSTEE